MTRRRRAGPGLGDGLRRAEARGPRRGGPRGEGTLWGPVRAGEGFAEAEEEDARAEVERGAVGVAGNPGRRRCETSATRSAMTAPTATSKGLPDVPPRYSTSRTSEASTRSTSTSIRGGGKYAGWTVIAGPNGTGKSTLLRAIALSVAGPSMAEKLQMSYARLDSGEGKEKGLVKTQLDLHVADWIGG